MMADALLEACPIEQGKLPRHQRENPQSLDDKQKAGIARSADNTLMERQIRRADLVDARLLASKGLLHRIGMPAEFVELAPADLGGGKLRRETFKQRAHFRNLVRSTFDHVVTRAPWFGSKSIRPSECSRRIASRTGVREIASALAISCSFNLVPLP